MMFSFFRFYLGAFLLIFLKGCGPFAGVGSSGTESTGEIDTEFNTQIGTGFNGSVDVVKVQSDGKILVGGRFTQFKGENVGFLVRLNSNGSLDESFEIGVGADSSVFALALDSDNNIFVGGAFSTFNGVSAKCLVKLDSTGAIESDFLAQIGGGFSTTGGSAHIAEIDVLSDGDILVSGEFSNFASQSVNGFLRLDSTGQKADSFMNQISTGPNFGVYALFENSSGLIFVGGAFTSFTGGTQNRFHVLNPTGISNVSWNNGFLGGFNATVNVILGDEAGGIWVGGGFDRQGSSEVAPLVRIDSNYEVDSDVNWASDADAWGGGTIYSLALQNNSKMVVGGDFGTPALSTTASANLARVATLTGEIDTSFQTKLGTGFSGGEVRALEIQSDGKILVGGEFNSLNGTSVGGLVRLK